MASPFLFISGRAKNRASYVGPGLKLYPMARESGMVDLEMGRSRFLTGGLLAMREAGEWHWSSLENLVEPHWLSWCFHTGMHAERPRLIAINTPQATMDRTQVEFQFV